MSAGSRASMGRGNSVGNGAGTPSRKCPLNRAELAALGRAGAQAAGRADQRTGVPPDGEAARHAAAVRTATPSKLPGIVFLPSSDDPGQPGSGCSVRDASGLSIGSEAGRALTCSISGIVGREGMLCMQALKGAGSSRSHTARIRSTDTTARCRRSPRG